MIKNIFSTLFTVFLLASCSSQPNSSEYKRATSSMQSRSSEIPARREFPVNPDINPCENFYEYACSKVIDSFELREDRSRHAFSFHDSNERILKVKMNYFGELEKKKKKLSSREKLLFSHYQACTSSESRANEEVSYVSKSVHTLESVTSREDLAAWLVKKVGSGEPHIYSVYLEAANQDNPLMYDYLLDINLMSLPHKDYYENEDLLSLWKESLVQFFDIISTQEKVKEKRSSVQRADDFIRFQKEFAAVYPTPEEQRELFSKRTYLNRELMIKKYPHMQLEALLKKIPKSTEVRDFLPKAFSFFDRALENESMEVLKDQILYTQLSSLMDEGYPEYFALKFDFKNKFLGGPPVRSERVERCTKDLMSKFTMEIDAELYKKVFPDFDKGKFIQLAEKIRASIIDGVKKNTWLSEKGRAGAILKMQKAELLLVSPNTVEEWNFVPRHKYSKDKYLSNSFNIQKALFKRDFARLSKNRNKRIWGMGPLTINAYYDPSSNIFVMPAGILQYPFYDQNLPDVTNLGAVGAVIGHELGHGIDDSGSKFDEVGRLRSWMSDADLAEFNHRGSRLVKQFEEIGHNGRQTLGENIGDLVGVTFAYNAARSGSVEFDVKQKQDFFLQWGRAWCQVARPKELERLLKVDSHSLSSARVNEQVKHQKGFQEAFSCKVGDAMVLSDEDRVSIW